ncbi:hypothetical protein HK405_012208, partial [Cladochytrium tenue]
MGSSPTPALSDFSPTLPLPSPQQQPPPPLPPGHDAAGERADVGTALRSLAVAATRPPPGLLVRVLDRLVHFNLDHGALSPNSPTQSTTTADAAAASAVTAAAPTEIVFELSNQDWACLTAEPAADVLLVLERRDRPEVTAAAAAEPAPIVFVNGTRIADSGWSTPRPPVTPAPFPPPLPRGEALEAVSASYRRSDILLRSLLVPGLNAISLLPGLAALATAATSPEQPASAELQAGGASTAAAAVDVNVVVSIDLVVFVEVAAAVMA